MKTLKFFLFMLIMGTFFTSCVSKKKFVLLERELEDRTNEARAYQNRVQDCNKKISEKDKAIALALAEQNNLASQIDAEKNINENLNLQIKDLKNQRDLQMTQVGDLTVLSKTANDNVGNTIKQLEQKDKYISLLNLAKNKTDSLNLALAVNLKSVLAKGILDEDIDVQVDKTVVFINLSDKMLYKSGSAEISDRANEVLEKIAQIIKSRPELEVMVEGYTDSNPINTQCIKDNWDLSVKRSTAVVRTLQNNFGIDPNKLIAAGRGEYNTLADNATEAGRSINRRTRIILLPKLNQFYDLLNPELADKGGLDK
ncbi:OmpA/MotB family protein [Portibacter lacus]|uniref:Flagellar motor protein MotB n=1 Tax=Portibacter lacus TaxID=1099794 RepID=A0AA37WCW5_9BACT|nr:OmpA family protein [Portibacter lacus]GLR17126.1 flagellar motor protein MotB [Portibacter lacus]